MSLSKPISNNRSFIDKLFGLESAERNKVRPFTKKRINHCLSFITLWTGGALGVNALGILRSRMLNGYCYHAAAGGALIGLTMLAGIYLPKKLKKKFKKNKDSWPANKRHLICASALMICCGTALLSGAFLYGFRLFPTKNIFSRSTVSAAQKIHMASIQSASLFGLFTTHLGIAMKMPALIIPFFAVYPIYLGAIQYCKNKRASTPKVVSKDILLDQKLLNDKGYDLIEELNSKGRKLMVYENKVFDMDHTTCHSENRDFLLGKFLGSEISRYINGGFEFMNHDSHLHSELALKEIEQACIGEIETDDAKKLYIPTTDRMSDPTDEIWRIVEKRHITTELACYGFKSDHFNTRAILPGLDYLGKYFILHSCELDRSRLYSVQFAMNQKILKDHYDLMTAYENGEEFLPIYPDINHVYRDNIEMFIRKYKEFTIFLDEVELFSSKNAFKIKGPFGPGMRLNKYADGEVVMFSFGWGVMTLTDIVTYLLRMNIYQEGLKRGQVYRIFKNEEFKELTHPNFKLRAFLSFKNENMISGTTFFDDLVKFNEAHGLNNFEYDLIYSEENPYTKEFLEQKIKNPEKIKKVFHSACHFDLENKLIENLAQVGIGKDKIQMV